MICGKMLNGDMTPDDILQMDYPAILGVSGA